MMRRSLVGRNPLCLIRMLCPYITQWHLRMEIWHNINEAIATWEKIIDPNEAAGLNEETVWPKTEIEKLRMLIEQ